METASRAKQRAMATAVALKTETRLKGMETESTRASKAKDYGIFENRDPLKGDGNQPSASSRHHIPTNFENRDPLKGDGNEASSSAGVDALPSPLKTETRLKGMETCGCAATRAGPYIFENRDPLKGDGNQYFAGIIFDPGKIGPLKTETRLKGMETHLSAPAQHAPDS